MRTTAFSREEFRADRRPILERGETTLMPAVRGFLEDREDADARDSLLAVLRSLFASVVEDEGGDSAATAGARTEFASDVKDALNETSPSTPETIEAQTERLATWLSTWATNAATAAAAATDTEDLLIEWVTMHDNDVRATHREADGQQVPPGATFNVNGFDLHYPGEPVGPIEVWINCRCVVRPAPGGDMAANLTAAAEPEMDVVEPEIDPEAPPITEDDLDLDVPFYGVAAPEGVATGDRRKFNIGSIRNRDLPIPFRHQPADIGGHDGAVTTGRIDNIWRDEASNLIKYEGVFARSAQVQDYIGQIADGFERGVSVDLDDTTFEVQNDDGTPFDPEAWQQGDPEPLSVVTSGRIAAITGVGIPAFQEAFVGIGTWADHDNTPVEPDTAECENCDVADALALMDPVHRQEFIDATDPDVNTLGFMHQASDGTVYEFDDVGLHVFTPTEGHTYAPGTHDGPGWVTHPKATERIRRYWVRGKGAKKIRWGQPGDFNRCRRQLAKYVPNPDWLAGLCANMHKEAIKVWPGREAGNRHALEGDPAPAFTLVASAAPTEVYPAEWFEDPGFTEITPIQVDADGRIFGHMAQWGVCHIGINGVCTTPPFSENGYANFHLHSVPTDAGPLPCGVLTMSTGHAGDHLTAASAASHYDNTGTLAAKVRAGEDAHGIWVAGVVSPGLSAADRFALYGATLSGDWREQRRGHMEMVASLVVNTPGFPVPHLALAASGDRQVSLVAAGIVHPREVEVATIEMVDISTLATQVADTLARRERAARVRAQTRSIRRAAVRAAIEGD
jgi:hypothetical protein